MKKYILAISAIISINCVNAQEIPDAIRLAQENLNGTARFRAMGGAFGALGGDLSAINVNPAGSVVFANNQAGGTLTSFNTKNNADYFGSKTCQDDSSFDLSQAGAVFIFEDRSGISNWNKFSFALNYENTNNYDNSLFSKGTNPTNSVANYFLSYANPNATQGGIFLNVLENSYYEDLNYADQQAFLGYQGYVINPTDGSDANNDTYLANNSGGNYYQENSVISTGFNGKLTFNGAASYKDKVLFGLSLNSHFTDYVQSSRFYESNNNSATTGLRNLTFGNDLYTYGTGFSFNLGVIGKINKEIRAGLSYESPTWYKLNDELLQTLSSTGYNYGTPADPNLSSTTVDSNITMIYDPYKLRTPSKFTGSLAYIFGKKGLISVDYSIKDYSNTKFKDPYGDFASVNNRMNDVLDTTGEIRIGAEYRIKQFSLRAGHRSEQSPYKNNWTIGNLNSYSGGLGYNFGDTKVDLSYTYAKRVSNPSFFEQGFTDAAKINSVNNNVSLTLLFEL
jgi:long-subunit fatty acid transport protein